MRILLDCRPLQYIGPGDERARLIFSGIRELVRLHGADCLYVVDKRGQREFLAGCPPERVVVRSALPGVTGWRIWYASVLPRVAKRWKADWVFTTGGMTAATGLRQGCWMTGGMPRTGRAESSGSKGSGNSGRPVWVGLAGRSLAALSRKRLAGSLAAAGIVFCFSAIEKDVLRGMIVGDGGKIHVVLPAPDWRLRVLGPEEKEAVKSQYAAGREYFFADVTGAGEGEVVELLKAFSRFKKRQLSNMQLVLAGRVAGVARGLAEKLETYKYREDIHLYTEYGLEGVCENGPGDGLEKGEAGNEPGNGGPKWKTGARIPGNGEEAGKRDGNAETGISGNRAAGWQLLAGAYAIVRFFGRESLGLPVLEAWRAGVPIITLTGGNVEAMAGDAALYVEAGNADSLAEKLKLIYKDEALRSSLVEKGFGRERGPGEKSAVEVIWGMLSGR